MNLQRGRLIPEYYSINRNINESSCAQIEPDLE